MEFGARSGVRDCVSIEVRWPWARDLEFGFRVLIWDLEIGLRTGILDLGSDLYFERGFRIGMFVPVWNL